MDFPMINLSLRITFNISGVTGGAGSSYCPWSCPPFAATSTLGSSGFSAAAVAVAAVSAAGSTASIASTEVAKLHKDRFDVGVSPRLFLKTVYFQAEEAQRLKSEIVKGYSKELVYSCSNYYQQSTTVDALTTNWAFVQGIIRPTRVWVFPLASGTIGASSNSFPASIGQYFLTNTNILLNGNNFYNNRFYTQNDFFREFRTQLIGAGSSTACGTPLSYDDWIAGCNPYVFDLSRNPTVKSNNLCTLTLQSDIQDQTTNAASAGALDLFIIVERLQTVTMKISEGGVEVITKQGASV
jgi:hypothetical protein